MKQHTFVPPVDAAVALVLDRIRAARFAAGMMCPRCGCARVYRWGSFSGRHRYKCRGCRRTFSDLTLTPAAYVKKLGLWADHAVLLERELTLRQVAAALGVHLSTAFDWRHRLLDELDRRDGQRLHGAIQLTELWFAYSAKGSRHPRAFRPAARRRFRRSIRSHVTVLVACDQKGDVVTKLLPIPRGSVETLRDALAWRIDGAPAFVGTTGPLSPAGILAGVLKGTFLWVRGFEKHTRLADALAYGVVLKRWLRKFCGVATHYLANYLIWHRVKREPPLRTTLLRWPLTSERLDPVPVEVADAA